MSDWLAVSKFELRQLEMIPPMELNELMVQFFVFVKKHDDDDYQSSTLSSTPYCVDRYLS